jgi:hypothetical protein
MTHYILPTDIELATKLLAANRPDAAVVAALVQRGVDSASAAKLVADLRDGRKVTPQIPTGLEIAPGRSSRSKKAAAAGEPLQPSRPGDANSLLEEPAEPAAESREKSSIPWLVAAVAFCFGVAVIGVLISNRLHRAAEEPELDKSRTVTFAPQGAAPTGSSKQGPQPSVPVGSVSSALEQGRARKLPAAPANPLTAGITNAPGLAGSSAHEGVRSGQKPSSP